MWNVRNVLASSFSAYWWHFLYHACWCSLHGRKRLVHFYVCNFPFLCVKTTKMQRRLVSNLPFFHEVHRSELAPILWRCDGGQSWPGSSLKAATVFCLGSLDCMLRRSHGLFELTCLKWVLKLFFTTRWSRFSRKQAPRCLLVMAELLPSLSVPQPSRYTLLRNVYKSIGVGLFLRYQPVGRPLLHTPL